jgi:hypothetical protein
MALRLGMGNVYASVQISPVWQFNILCNGRRIHPGGVAPMYEGIRTRRPRGCKVATISTEGDVQPHDVETIQARDVIILAKRAQKVSPEVVNELLRMLSLGAAESGLASGYDSGKRPSTPCFA